MFKIIKILNHGGACPFQVDALTDDSRLIYGRYRHGHLTVQIGKVGDFSEYAAVNGEKVFSSHVGEQFDGYMTLEEFKNHTKEVLDFSEAVEDS